MIRISLFVLLFFTIQTTFSQCSLDSVYWFNQIQQRTEALILAPTFRMQGEQNSYGILELNQQFGQGRFRQAQQAFSNRNTSFTAKGFNQLGRFHVGAVFTFNNQYEDSLANNLRSNLNDLATFYPYANQSGRYQRQNYKLNAALAFQATDHVKPFIKLDYLYHWSAGTVDPRLKATRFELRAKPGVAFTYGAHQLGVYGIIGKGDEQVSLSYKNDVFSNSMLYPDRIYHMSYGYGSSVIRDFSNNYKYDSYLGGGLEYASMFRDWKMQANAEWQRYHNTNQITSKGSAYYTGIVGEFELQSWKANLALFGPSNKSTQQSFSLDALYQSGFDGNIRTTGSLDIVNYKVNTLDLLGRYDLLWDKDKPFSKEIGLDVKYASSSRQDLVQSVDFNIADVDIGAHFRAYVQQRSGNRMKFAVLPYFRLPTETSLTYNTYSKSEFVRNVIFTDYYYNAARYVGSQFQAEYIGQFFGKNHLGFYANFDYRRASNPELRPDFDPTFVPNGNRWETNVGIRMYIQ
ncbi:DUF6850 family outer membrane beta-barrel protein [Sphingobacterium corticis]|uniref:DUF6850 family outer membrane beta-barrel protein n=1 Tax=Sphingobacterium corticis TaxID=1812823 RepID=A0ABW5NM24_9SPHI